MADEQISPEHEITKAFLFLHTAQTAVSNWEAQIDATRILLGRSILDNAYSIYAEHENQLSIEERELEMWKRYLLDAQLGLVDWAARRALNDALPVDIMDIIRTMLPSE